MLKVLLDLHEPKNVEGFGKIRTFQKRVNALHENAFLESDKDIDLCSKNCSQFAMDIQTFYVANNIFIWSVT